MNPEISIPHHSASTDEEESSAKDGTRDQPHLRASRDHPGNPTDSGRERAPQTPDAFTSDESENLPQPPGDLLATPTGKNLIPEATRQRLHADVIRWWRWHYMMNWSVLLALLLTGGVSAWIFAETARIPLVLAAVAILCFMLWTLFGYPKRKYAHWSYRLRRGVVEIRYGLLWRTTVSIPCSRLQHVDTRRGPLERRLDLATLVIHTAGTKAPTHEISGLNHATALRFRDHLLVAADLETPSEPENPTIPPTLAPSPAAPE